MFWIILTSLLIASNAYNCSVVRCMDHSASAFGCTVYNASTCPTSDGCKISDSDDERVCKQIELCVYMTPQSESAEFDIQVIEQCLVKYHQTLTPMMKDLYNDTLTQQITIEQDAQKIQQQWSSIHDSISTFKSQYRDVVIDFSIGNRRFVSRAESTQTKIESSLTSQSIPIEYADYIVRDLNTFIKNYATFLTTTGQRINKVADDVDALYNDLVNTKTSYDQLATEQTLINKQFDHVRQQVVQQTYQDYFKLFD